MIENKRREARGEELLSRLDQDAAEEPDTDTTAAQATESQESEQEEQDVLLTEAGNVLVDTLLLKRRAYAAHTPPMREEKLDAAN